MHISGGVLTLFGKTIKGILFGSADPQYDIVKLLRLYDAGQLKLDELVTTRYTPRGGERGLPGPAGRQELPRRHGLRER